MVGGLLWWWGVLSKQHQQMFCRSVGSRATHESVCCGNIVWMVLAVEVAIKSSNRRVIYGIHSRFNYIRIMHCRFPRGATLTPSYDVTFVYENWKKKRENAYRQKTIAQFETETKAELWEKSLKVSDIWQTHFLDLFKYYVHSHEVTDVALNIFICIYIIWYPMGSLLRYHWVAELFSYCTSVLSSSYNASNTKYSTRGGISSH